MRAVLLLLVLAGLTVALLYVVGDDESTHAISRRDGPRDRDREPVEREERTGYLEMELRVESSSGVPATNARVVYEGPSSGEAQTGKRGNLRIDGLAAGFYSLRVSCNGELGSIQFDLRETTHLGTLRLEASKAVRGHVFDASGSPLADAVIEAIASSDDALAELARSAGEPDAVAARATSDEGGAYEVQLAGERSYAFRATAHGYAVARAAKRRIHGAETIDFHLQAGAAARGRVVDPQGSPVAGALVLLVEPGLPKAETVTARDGTFEVHSNPSGFPTLVVRAPGFASHFQRGLRLPAFALRVQLERGISVRLRVIDDEDRNLALPGVQVIVDMESGFASGVTDGNGSVVVSNLPARRDAAASGDHVILWGDRHAARVHPISVPIPMSGELDLGDLSIGRGGTVSGRVVEEGSGRPVSGATVRSFGGLPRALAIAAAATGVTAQDGSFLLEGVPLGSTHLIALHPDFAAPPELARLLSGQATEGGGPLFREGSTTTERAVTLRRAARIRGVVQDADGKPVAKASVNAVSPDANLAAQIGGAPAFAVSGADGRFSIPGLADGTQLIASHPEQGTSDATSATDNGETILQLRPTTGLDGVVVDERAQPVAGVRISAGTRVVVSDEDGKFALAHLLPGTVQLRFDHPAYLPLERATEAAANAETLRVELARGPTIVGTVADGSGSPVAGAVVTASLVQGQMGTGRFWARATSNGQGEFAICGLAKGTYRLECEASGHLAESVQAHPGATEPATLVLREAARMEGRIVRGKDPIAGAQIEAHSETGSVGWTTSRVDGSFSFGSLPPGARLKLFVRHDGYAPTEVMDVASDGKGIVVALDAGVQLGGVVQLTDGTPVPRALVEVLVNRSRARLATADDRGRFLAGGLPEGELTVRVLESGQGLLASDPAPASPGDLELIAVAERGESITGMVVLPDGSPASRVHVTAIAANGTVMASAWVNRPGDGFVLRGLRGLHTVRAERDPRRDEPRLSGELPGVAAGSSRIEVRLERR